MVRKLFPDVVTAMEWLLSNGSGENDGQKEENIATLESMGFNSIQAEKALINCDGNVERAIEWLFNNPDIADEDDAEEISSLTLFNGEYELVGFISHMGANTACGHYVCHVKKVSFSN